MKYLIAFVALLAGLKFGYDYLQSDDFQRYGDENAAQWTCYVNNLMGELEITMSHYDRALQYFLPVLKRCPKTSMAEEATFKTATCLEQMGRRGEAAEVYRRYVALYPNTRRARIAQRAADIITGP
jgi:TolA-binding protein